MRGIALMRDAYDSRIATNTNSPLPIVFNSGRDGEPPPIASFTKPETVIHYETSDNAHSDEDREPACLLPIRLEYL